jgi:hypothetical protein
MKVLRFTLLGHEIWALELFDEKGEEDLSLTKGDVEKMVEEIRGKRVGGGQLLETERDHNPIIPGTEKDYDSWVDRPFGFNK